MCWGHFLKSLHLEGLQLYEEILQHMCFPVKFVKFLRTYFYRTPPVTGSPLPVAASVFFLKSN